MTLPSKKSINTELLIDRKQGRYTQKWLVEFSGKIVEVKMCWQETKRCE